MTSSLATGCGHRDGADPIGGWRNRPVLGFALPAVLAAILFAADLAAPLGYFNGALYGVLVIASLWQPWTGTVFLTAGTASLLTLLGYYLSPPALDPELAIVNRLLGVVVIWTAAIAVYWPRRLAAERRRNAERLHYLAEVTQIVPYTAPVDAMRMDYIDGKIEDLLGYPTEHWYREGFWSSHIHPDDREDVLRIDYLMRTHGGGNEVEYRMIAADGRVVWLRDVARVTDGPHGRRQYFGFLMDVTETRLRDRQLAESQKMKAIGQLTGGLAHDFNNLLAVITSNLQLIEDHAERNPQLRLPLRNAMLAANSGASIVQQLLAFARREPVRPMVLSLNEVIGQMIDLLDRTLGSKVEVETDLAAGLWPVAVDAGQFEAALLNLAVNARDAMPDGGRLRIATANVTIVPGPGEELTLPPGPYVLVSVSDTGQGMSDEVRARAFEPFFTTKPAGQGNGLGLCMVNAFVTGMGGQMKLESSPGKGTVAKLLFPRAAAKIADDAGEALPRRRVAGRSLPGHEQIEMAELSDKPGRR